MTKEVFIGLLEKYRRQQLSAEELNAFLDATADPELEALMMEKLGAELEAMNTAANAGADRQQEVWAKVNAVIDGGRDINTEQDARQPEPGQNKPRRIGWAAAAAAAALLLGVLGYWQFKTPPHTPAVTIVNSPDIAPGKQGAVLVLANGQEVVLDSTQNGMVAMQNGARVMLQNGNLSYDADKHKETAITYNTLRIPKGRQFQLTLPDGSKVWLNAASSLRYPTVFSGSERKVEITGEAYFDIAPIAKQPFKVNVNNKTEIAVLGTQFNVNAYANENVMKATLLQGSIKVADKILQPGQQAQTTQETIVVNNIDTAQVTAWKEGLFNFEGAHLQEVMRQLERWYDIEVVYENGVPDTEFSGEMTKGISLNGVLIALEKSGVHFRREGRKLIVLP